LVGCCSNQRLLNRPLLFSRRGVSAFKAAAAQNPYQVLGIKPSADTKEIKEAFFTKSKLNHPDLNPDAPPEKFQEIVEAYEFLSDADKKSQLDSALQQPRGHGGGMDWRANLRRDEAPTDEWGRKVDVDMSLEAMKRRWSLYKKHWEGEEERLKELEELKTAFRIKLDEKRKMFEHLTEEEQVQFKESIRTFRHPKFSKGITEVILTDKENEVRQEKSATGSNNLAGYVSSWLKTRILQSIHPEYDSTVLSQTRSSSSTSSGQQDASSTSSGQQDASSTSSGQQDASPTSSGRHRTVSCDDTAGYTTTNQRKKSFANNINDTDVRQKMAENRQTKRHYSTFRQSDSSDNEGDSSDNVGDNVTTVINKSKQDFDPYEYMRNLQQKEQSSDVDNPLVARFGMGTDFEKEAERVGVAVDEVMRRNQKLQMYCYKMLTDPKRTFDDDDPNFKPVKKYFKDETDPLRSVKAEVGSQRHVKDMEVKEIIQEAFDNLKANTRPKKVLSDGGEEALRQGQRFRSEYKISQYKAAALLAFLAVLGVTVYALEARLIELGDTPSEEYLKAAQQERKISQQKNQDNKDRD